MSPMNRDIHVESEGTAASERNYCLRQRDMACTSASPPVRPRPLRTRHHFIARNRPSQRPRRTLWGVLQDRWCSELRLAGAQRLTRQPRAAPLHRDYTAPRARPTRQPPGWRPAPETSSVSARSARNASSATTTWCNGRPRFQSRTERRFSFAGPKSSSTRSRWPRLALLRRYPLEHTMPRGVTFHVAIRVTNSCCYNSRWSRQAGRAGRGHFGEEGAKLPGSFLSAATRRHWHVHGVGRTVRIARDVSGVRRQPG